jgi:GntR family transcriptional regulator / MocR family aminotransferase
LLVALDRRNGIPLHEQLERQLRASIRSGRLAAGTRLPSTRSLASELDVARTVVVEAYYSWQPRDISPAGAAPRPA